MHKRFTLLVAAAVATVACALPNRPAEARNIVTMNTVQVFGTVDPAKINDYTEYMAGVNLYDALVTVDSKGQIVPQLAESWQISEDARTFEFTLKAGATFQDGSPVTADDVVYSVRRILAINQGPSYLYAKVLSPDAIEAVDDRTVRFTLSKTYSPFLTTVPLMFVVNADVVQAQEKDGDWGQDYLANAAAGAGPYMMHAWERGSRMTVRRYEGYHGGWGDDAVDEIRWIVTNDEATVRSLAASGELTMTSQYQANETYEALGKMERFRVEQQPTATAFYLKMNRQTPPTDDVHIRRAIACGMDYDLIREEIYPGTPLIGPMPEIFEKFHIGSEADAPRFDPECVKQEIAKSKYAGQGKIPIVHAYVAGAAFEEEIALLFKATMEPLGFDVTLQPEPWNRITELASKKETTPAVTQVFYGPTYPSPDSMFFTQYHSDAVGTWSSMEWVESPEVDALIDAARATGDEAEQVRIYKDLQRKIIDLQTDAFLLTQIRRHAIDKCLTGWQAVPMQSFEYDFSRFSWTCGPNG